VIQADLVHRAGNTGAGIKIAVVDTGIDYNHPAFGSCFRTKGCKVQKGYDFVGDDFDGSNDRVPDDDPYSNCNFHGTAVAGMAAGLDNPFDAPGAAPGAIIFPYRVFGCSGSTYSDIELAAMMKAEEDGADVINFSISSDPGWSGSALGVAAANLAKKGIQCGE
jgi:subtilisin family serine protease